MTLTEARLSLATWYAATWTKDGQPTRFTMDPANHRYVYVVADPLTQAILHLPMEDAKTELRSERTAEGKLIVAGQQSMTQQPLPEPVQQPQAAPTMPNTGTYTIEHTDGGYETIRIRNHWDSSRQGELVAEYLSGPDNDSSYTGFAFITPGGLIKTWRKFTTDGHTPSPAMARWVAAINTLLRSDATEAAEAYARRSGRCSRCNRTLTVPASLHRGYGPECAAQLGI